MRLARLLPLLSLSLALATLASSSSPMHLGGPSPPLDRTLSPAQNYSLLPQPDGWVNSARPLISVTLLDENPGVDVKTSLFILDGLDHQPAWDAESQTFQLTPPGDLDEGSHSVSFSVMEVGGLFFNVSWTFHVDTVPPAVLIRPLPSTVLERGLTVEGAVAEPNLAAVAVNGQTVPVDEEGQYAQPVLLWPGPNDIVVTATDHAMNEDQAVSYVRWEPSESSLEDLLSHTHANASFTIHLPAEWDIFVDPVLESGGQADLVGLGSLQPGTVPPSISVLSTPVTSTLTGSDLLDIMNQALEDLIRDVDVLVLSRPRLRGSQPQAVSGEFSVVQNLGQPNATFLFATYVWNGAVARIWVILASSSVLDAAGVWPDFAASVGSFHVNAPEPPPGPFDVFRETVLVVAPFAIVGSAIIVLAFFMVLRLRRKRRES